MDNILNKWADPSMLGAMVAKDCDIICKYSGKKHALERVGVYAYLNSMPYVIEYSIIGETLAKKTNDKGELLYNHSNLLNFMVRMSFLKDKILDEKNINELNQKYNVSIKDVRNFDLARGAEYDSKGVKFEIFIHECLSFCDPSKFVLLECNRDHVYLV